MATVTFVLLSTLVAVTFASYPNAVGVNSYGAVSNSYSVNGGVPTVALVNSGPYDSSIVLNVDPNSYSTVAVSSGYENLANNAYGVNNNAYGVNNNAYGVNNNAYGVNNNAYGVNNNAYGVNSYSGVQSDYAGVNNGYGVASNSYATNGYGAQAVDNTAVVYIGEPCLGIGELSPSLTACCSATASLIPGLTGTRCCIAQGSLCTSNPNACCAGTTCTAVGSPNANIRMCEVPNNYGTTGYGNNAYGNGNTAYGNNPVTSYSGAKK